MGERACLSGNRGDELSAPNSASAKIDLSLTGRSRGFPRFSEPQQDAREVQARDARVPVMSRMTLPDRQLPQAIGNRVEWALRARHPTSRSSPLRRHAGWTSGGPIARPPRQIRQLLLRSRRSPRSTRHSRAQAACQGAIRVLAGTALRARAVAWSKLPLASSKRDRRINAPARSRFPAEPSRNGLARSNWPDANIESMAPSTTRAAAEVSFASRRCHAAVAQSVASSA